MLPNKYCLLVKKLNKAFKEEAMMMFFNIEEQNFKQLLNYTVNKQLPIVEKLCTKEANCVAYQCTLYKVGFNNLFDYQADEIFRFLPSFKKEICTQF